MGISGRVSGLVDGCTGGLRVDDESVCCEGVNTCIVAGAYN